MIYRDTLRIAESELLERPPRGRGRGIVTQAAEAWLLSLFQRYGRGRAWLTPSFIEACAFSRQISVPGMDLERPFPGHRDTLYRALARLLARGALVQIAGPRGSLYALAANARAAPTYQAELLRDLPTRGTKAAYWIANLPGVDAIASVGILDDDASSRQHAEASNLTRKRWNFKFKPRTVA